MAPEELPSLHRGLGIAASSFVVNVVLTTIAAVAVSRLYGVDVIGQMALASAPYLFTLRFSTFAEQSALLRELAVRPRRDPHATGLAFATFTFSLALTVPVAAVAFAVSTLLLRGPVGQPHLVAPAALLVVAYVLFENTSWNIDTMQAACGGVRELFMARTAQAVVFLIAAVLLAQVTDSVWGIALATIISFGGALAVRALTLPRFAHLRPGRAAVREGFRGLPAILRFGARALPGYMAGNVASQGAIWIVGITQPVSAVGAYARASSIAGWCDGGPR